MVRDPQPHHRFLRVGGVAPVWVNLHGAPVEGALDLGAARTSRHAEDVIVPGGRQHPSHRALGARHFHPGRPPRYPCSIPTSGSAIGRIRRPAAVASATAATPAFRAEWCGAGNPAHRRHSSTVCCARGGSHAGSTANRAGYAPAVSPIGARAPPARDRAAPHGVGPTPAPQYARMTGCPQRHRRQPPPHVGCRAAAFRRLSRRTLPAQQQLPPPRAT
eukprot:scaffold35860_cov129-Isochrysis_galbana.AAC.5